MSGGWFRWTAVEPGGPPVPGCWWGTDAVEVADMVAAEFRLAGVEVAVDVAPIMLLSGAHGTGPVPGRI